MLLPECRNEIFDYLWDWNMKWGKTSNCRKGGCEGVMIKMGFDWSPKTRIVVMKCLKLGLKVVKKDDIDGGMMQKKRRKLK